MAEEKGFSEDIERRIKKLSSDRKLMESRAGFRQALAKKPEEDAGLFTAPGSEEAKREIAESTARITSDLPDLSEDYGEIHPEHPDVISERGISDIIDSFVRQRDESVLDTIDPATLDKVLIVINRHVSTGFDSDAEYRELKGGLNPAFGDYSPGSFRKGVRYMM